MIGSVRSIEESNSLVNTFIVRVSKFAGLKHYFISLKCTTEFLLYIR